MLKRPIRLPPEHLYPTDEWRVVETRYSGRYFERAETTFSLANGYLGMRGSLDEGRPAVSPGSFVSGFHETWRIVHAVEAHGLARTGQTIVNVPDATVIRLYVDDEPLFLPTARLRADAGHAGGNAEPGARLGHVVGQARCRALLPAGLAGAPASGGDHLRGRALRSLRSGGDCLPSGRRRAGRAGGARLPRRKQRHDAGRRRRPRDRYGVLAPDHDEGGGRRRRGRHHRRCRARRADPHPQALPRPHHHRGLLAVGLGSEHRRGRGRRRRARARVLSLRAADGPRRRRRQRLRRRPHRLGRRRVAGLGLRFGGVRDFDSELSITPRLPPAWESLDFSLRFGDRQLRVHLAHDEERYLVEEGDPLEVTIRGEPRLLAPSRPLVILPIA